MTTVGRVRIAALAFAALSIASPGSAAAQSASHPVFGATMPHVERLPNGLTVIAVPFESPSIVAYHTLVRVGSRDEVEPGHSGYAHLFEHMMFRGTARYPQDRYEATIQSFGADNNAYTTQDSTVYTVTAPSAALERIVELEADRFQHLAYDEAAYRTETGAVRGEYDTSVSNPFLKMWESLSELAFRQHTYGHTTLGYLRDIDAMPEEFAYSRRFFSRFYTPDNCTVIVVGDVEPARLTALVREHYGAWRGRRVNPRVPVEPEPRGGDRRDVEWPAPAAPRLLVGYRTPAFVPARAPRDAEAALRSTAALQVIDGLMFSSASPLYQRLVVGERRLLELSSWSGDFSRDPHLFVFQATLADEPSFDAILGEIQSALAGLADPNAIDAAQVEAVKSNLRYGLLSDLETPADLADLIARMIAVGGDLGVIDRYLAALAAITPQDVAHAARTYLTEGRRYVVTLSHRGGGQ